MSEACSGAKAVKKLLDERNFSFSKSMGQNFLIDDNITKKMVRLSGIDESCGVIEVGPGIGALTLELSRAAGCVIAVELDRRLLPVLEETFADQRNVVIMQGDILKLDIKNLVSEKMPGLSKYHVCANLPYNITTPVISDFISMGIFDSMTVMVQKEVARRICAGPGSADYGAFTVYVSYHTAPRPLFDVPPECFMPRPGVWSSVIAMKSREERPLKPEQEKKFFGIVRAAFSQRRKTLVNALFSVYGNTVNKADITDIIKQCGFDERVRGETLSTEDFIMLSAKMIHIGCMTSL